MESWEEGERKADEDVAAGRLTDITSKEELDRFFDGLEKKEPDQGKK